MMTEIKANTAHREMCALVANALPNLQFRHHGIGVLQAYILENPSYELRVHIWHPSLETPGISESGNIHDHRFDLISCVLLGSITHVEYDVCRWDEGAYRMHSVVPARKAKVASGSYHMPREIDADRYDIIGREMTIIEGQSYRFPAQRFHKSISSQLAVTLVAKTNILQDVEARILSPIDKPCVHAFAQPLPESTWRPLIDEAHAALLAKDYK